MFVLFVTPAAAKPGFMSEFNEQYPNSPWVNICLICHGDLNDRTDYLSDWILFGKDFTVIENLDSDGDGILNTSI